MLREYLSEPHIEQIKKAYAVSAAAHDGQRRLEGQKYINHPLSVAALLAEKKLDSSTIIAALLHDTLEDTRITREELAREFGEEIAGLVDSVSKLDRLGFESPQHAQVENLRRLFLAAASDVRVILIKVADRMHNLQSVTVHRPEKVERIVKETENIYIPIAHLLGIGSWRREMDRLCFRALNPKRYSVINDAIKKGFKNTSVEQAITNHISTIEQELNKRQIEGEVTGRVKEIRAIYEKMRKKGNSLKNVLDVFAFRIIVKTEDDCYRVLGLIHKLFKPVASEFNDYIAIPKINGYQSLHTTVHGIFGRAIEFQIRTEGMHRVAESGVASHLAYKGAQTVEEDTKLPGIQWFHEVVHSLEEHKSPADFLENLNLKLFSDYVYVFTPKGHIKQLKKGATVIDFAYSIHTAVGNGTTSAKIDNHPVPLHTILNNGDMVEIHKSRFSRPDPAWLDFAATGDARYAIRRALKDMSSKDLVKMGERLFKAMLKKFKIKQNQVTNEMKNELAARLGADSWNDILSEIATGERFAAAVIGQLFPSTFLNSNSTSSEVISIQGTEGLGVKYAKCCTPVPGEPIVGAFNRGRGIVVHTQNCSNVRHSNLAPEFWQKLNWADEPKGEYRVTLRVNCQNVTGVLASITSSISSHKADIASCNTSTSENDAMVVCDIQVKSLEHLNTIAENIERNKRVKSVERVTLN